MRRNAFDILQTSQRLHRAGLKFTDSGATPVWHAALLSHPPAPPLPIRKNMVRPIAFPEDKIREQFFTDFPFEAFRAKSITERERIQPPQTLTGKAWWSLSQVSLNPTSDDCINLVVNLRSYHNMSTAQAYAIATAQFAHLRAIQEHATRSAAHEARAYGGRLTGGEINRSFKKVANALASWQPPSQRQLASPPKVWQADPKPSFHALAGTFSGGEKYVKGWSKWNEVMDRRRLGFEEAEERRRRSKTV